MSEAKADLPLLSAVIHALGAEIREINQANGWAVIQPEEWADKYKIPGVIALIHSEASEALEGFRADDKANFAEELADVIIRCLDLSHGLGIDMGAEITRKLAKNRTRGFKHGGKKI